MISSSASAPSRIGARDPALSLVAAALFAFICFAAPVSPASGRTVAASKTKTTTAPKEDVETRIKTLHQQLRISSQQEPAFNDVAQVMRENAARMKELQSRRAENEQSMNAVDELETYTSIVDAHADGLRKLTPAFRTLYDSMSPEQKKTADAVFREKAREAARRRQR
jgi:hypothetical protein